MVNLVGFSNLNGLKHCSNSNLQGLRVFGCFPLSLMYNCMDIMGNIMTVPLNVQKVLFKSII